MSVVCLNIYVNILHTTDFFSLKVVLSVVYFWLS